MSFSNDGRAESMKAAAPKPQGGTPALGWDPAACGAAPPPAWSVTRLPQITNSDSAKCRRLLLGLDGLDLGLNVTWGKDWPVILRQFEDLKHAAIGSDGLLWEKFPDIPCLFHPSGKGSNYRFRLQFRPGLLFISKSGVPNNRPNAYLSLASESLWNLGVDPSIDVIRTFIERLGGKLEAIKPSRVDVCSDFLFEYPLTLDFLRSHLVSYASKTRHHENGGKLETFYVGDSSSPLQIRIYDKIRELGVSGKKDYFKALWGIDTTENVWRVEVQMRRELLKQFDCYTLSDLNRLLKWMWCYATENWCSFRNRDDSNTHRRSVCDWWKQVQECGHAFADSTPRKRTRSNGQAGIDYYRDRLGGALVRYAALSGFRDFDEALEMARNDLLALPVGREFTQRVKIAELKLMSDYGPAPQPGHAFPADWDGI